MMIDPLLIDVVSIDWGGAKCEASRRRGSTKVVTGSSYWEAEARA
jgi:hypothetical protein